MTAVEWPDVQGLAVSGYGKMREARYLFLRMSDPAGARRWIAELADRVTASAAPEERRCINVALTCSGLTALGLDQAELRTFAVPFHEGMTAEHRQRVLGDTEASAPRYWAWGGTPDDRAPGANPASHDIHAVLLLYATDGPTLAQVEADEVARLTAGGLEVAYPLEPAPLPGEVSAGKSAVEHFGFADGLSQPVIEGSRQDARIGGDDRRRSVIAAGEFLLGYPNGYGELTPWPKLSGAGGEGFGRNGSYLVVRQLAQDVAGFWHFLAEHTDDGDGQGAGDRDRMERLAAKLVGRWPSGAPLVLSDHRDDPDLGSENGFGYAEIDPYGERCPLGAHIRRANPRDALGDDPVKALELANLHRIIRRGRVYGPTPDDVAVDDGVDRGLVFIGLNANIERQFEFVQHTWLNNPKFAGLYDETDALLGNPRADGRFTVQGAPLRTRLRGLPSFVAVRGGAYFFMPGVRALRMLGVHA